MPSNEQSVYNPFILGFVDSIGPVFIPLQKAQKIYGRLPSDFHMVKPKDGRKEKKGLNLSLGKAVTEMLKNGPVNLKGRVFAFFQEWHRDFKEEFGIAIEPFLSLNSRRTIFEVFKRNRSILEPLAAMDLRNHLENESLIRKDVLNSIPEEKLQAKADQMVERRMKGFSDSEGFRKLQQALDRIRASGIIRQLEKTTGMDFRSGSTQRIGTYSDEIAKALVQFSQHIPLSGTEQLEKVDGSGVEFEYAPRDLSYLLLGKKTGDCTADKSPFQADRDIENIYWTVFPWLLDRNYQILKVYFQGEFVMKVHLMPLYILTGGAGEMALAVDAIETVRSFRDDLTDQCKDDLLENREPVFHAVVEKIRKIGEQMGIRQIYAEKFSNTPWVRECFGSYPEIFLHVNQVVKLDELEDVFCLARELCGEMGQPVPGGVFMEMQMKNTSLLPRVSKKNEGIKSFAVIMGSPDAGIPMKKVIGI